jgi:hypothetical protein
MPDPPPVMNATISSMSPPHFAASDKLDLRAGRNCPPGSDTPSCRIDFASQPNGARTARAAGRVGDSFAATLRPLPYFGTYHPALPLGRCSIASHSPSGSTGFSIPPGTATALPGLIAATLLINHPLSAFPLY